MMLDKKEECRSELISRILTLEISPGSMLDEAELSSEFDLSRTPLREVFQTLAGEGYISLVRNRGAKVSSMNLESMRSFFQTAPMIYCAVGRLAAESAKPEQINELQEVQRRFRLSCENGETASIAMLNHRFHELIGEMADNIYMAPTLRRLLIDHTRMSQKFYKPQNSQERLQVWAACDHHDKIIEAIEARDEELIVQITLDHWELSRNQIEKFTKPDPLEFGLEKTG
jgi:DNA-binding GntR family transcriptional regulator